MPNVLVLSSFLLEDYNLEGLIRYLFFSFLYVYLLLPFLFLYIYSIRYNKNLLYTFS